MPGFIIQPQTLLAIGPSRQFGGSTNPPASTFVGPTLPGQAGNLAVGNQGQPVFKGYVTITENAVDAIEITQQPVQQGAAIADHAFKKPTTLSIQIQFGASLTQSLSTIYKNLLTLQGSFVPFNVVTPKRTYGSMLFASLGLTTDKSSENILSINTTFQQIITVPIGIVTLNRNQLSRPGSNGATQGAGAKQPQTSALATIAGV